MDRNSRNIFNGSFISSKAFLWFNVVFVPIIIISFLLLSFAAYKDGFYFCIDKTACFENFTSIFKLPINLASLWVVMITVLSIAHKSEETQSQNSFNNYLSHKKYFNESVDLVIDRVEKSKLIVSSKGKLYKAFFNNNGPSKITLKSNAGFIEVIFKEIAVSILKNKEEVIRSLEIDIEHYHKASIETNYVGYEAAYKNCYEQLERFLDRINRVIQPYGIKFDSKFIDAVDCFVNDDNIAKAYIFRIYELLESIMSEIAEADYNLTQAWCNLHCSLKNERIISIPETYLSQINTGRLALLIYDRGTGEVSLSGVDDLLILYSALFRRLSYLAGKLGDKRISAREFSQDRHSTSLADSTVV